MKLKKLLASVLALVMCISMGACGTDTAEQAATTNPEVSMTTNTESSESEEKAELVSITVPENWDFSVGFYPVITPMVSSTYGAGFWSRNFYNTLVSYDDNGMIQGELAETWEISEDGKTYTFHLRDGVKFSDGTPLTSEAVKMTLEAVVTHLGPQNGAFGKLTTLFDKLETPDEKTFVMTLKAPYYAALDNLTMALPLGIVNPAAFEGGVEKAYENCVSATMGTGPYMFDRVEGDTYTFIRNPYYWGEAPEVDEFKVKVIPDNAAKILALRSGEIDAILGSSRLSAEGYTEISQDAAFGHAMDDSTNQTRYLGMNLNKAPFNDPLVREAVSYAVNQQELEASVFDGLETAAETLFTNEKPNCGVEVKTYPTDMEKAKQIMKEAGYEDTNDDGVLEKDGTPLAIHFNYSQSLASVDNAVLSIAASLKELGFDVTIDAVDMNTWYGALMAGEYDLTFYNTAGGSFDPATDMSNMAPGAMGDPILCQFSAFFENPEIFTELDSTSDPQRVQEIYGMILNGIADQNLLVPVTGTHDLALWNTDKITGYDFYADASYVDIASVHVK